MKTKLLSKLMLVCFTAVMMVGCNNESKNEVKVDKDASGTTNKNDQIKPMTSDTSDCKVCNDKDTYKITPDSVLILISNFHNEFIKTNKVSNAGGYISFNKVGTKPINKILSEYFTLKFHWGYQENGDTKRLFVTLEQKDPKKKCINNEYGGKLGVESEKLFTSLLENDVKPFGLLNTSIETTDVLKGLMDPQNITKDLEETILKKDAETFLNKFNTAMPGMYQCPDIVFDNTKTGAIILASATKNGLIYFFGYDNSQSFHKLRLIIAGVDGDKKIVFFSADDFMFRENSRPRP